MAEGFKDFTPGAVFSAGDVDDYLMRQSVMRFANATARDAALTAGIRTEGMVAYLLDVNTLTVYTGAAWSTVGPVHGVWVDYTPTIGQGGAVARTVVWARYARFGRTVHAAGRLATTAAGAANNVIAVDLPVTAATTAGILPCGPGWCFDSGTNLFGAIVVINTPTLMAFALTSAGAVANPGALLLGQTGAGTNWTLASGDAVGWSIIYEAAGDA